MSEKTNDAKIIGKYAVITALISGACLVISAFIGIFSIDISKTNKTLEKENTELFDKNNDSNTTNIFIAITSSAVKIRSGAGINYNIISTAKLGAKFILIDTVKGTDTYDWYKISIGDTIGYIRSDLAVIVE